MIIIPTISEICKPHHPNDQTNKKNTKNFPYLANDLRRDQEAATTTTNQKTNNGEHPSHTLQPPTNTTLKTYNSQKLFLLHTKTEKLQN